MLYYMRSAVSFLIGCVLGATGILLYLQETSQLAIAAERPSVNGAPASVGVLEARLKPGFHLLVPVLGISPDALRADFDQPRSGGRKHGAIDIRAPKGTPVVAALDGKIRKLFTSRAGGITIYQTDSDEQRIYYYAHLDRYADGLKEGMSVKQGDVIGYVGTSGNAPAGAPHLHFAVMILPPTKEWWKGEAIDPYPMLTGAASATTKPALTLR